LRSRLGSKRWFETIGLNPQAAARVKPQTIRAAVGVAFHVAAPVVVGIFRVAGKGQKISHSKLLAAASPLFSRHRMMWPKMLAGRGLAAFRPGVFRGAALAVVGQR
jgi:hypothetical protein